MKFSFTHFRLRLFHKIPLALFVIFWLGFLIFSTSKPPKSLTATKGVLDLTDWNFQTSGNIKLEGEWEFYWQELLTPHSYPQRGDADIREGDFITLPSTWNGHLINHEKIQGNGFASYRLTIKTIERDQILSVLVKPMATAYELWINGKLVAANGKIGTSAKSMQPQYLSKVASFSHSGKEIEILLRISNFMHRRGGVWRAIILGDAENITRLRDKKTAKDWILAVGFLVLALYHFAVFIQRRKDIWGFYFAGFCLFMAIRVWSVGQRLLYTALADFGWEVSHKIEYISLMLSIQFLLAFVRSLFPEEYKGPIPLLTNGITALFVLIVLVTKSQIYSWVIIPFEIFAILMGLYATKRLYHAIRRKRTNAKLVMSSGIVVCLAGINDAFHVNQIIFTVELFHFGVLFAALMHTLVLSRIFVNALDTSEHLAVELAGKNATLDESNRRIEQRSKELEQQLFRSQKLEAIGTLTGGIAHDFNNILGTMQGYVEMMIDKKAVNSEERLYLEQVYLAGDRAADLVGQLLTFSRAGNPKRKPIDIAPIVKEVLKLLRATLPATIEISQNIDSHDRLIMANETQIHQVVLNLCTNAGHAIGENSGVLEIILTEIERESDQPQIPSKKKEPYLQLTVRDTGSGMTEDIKDKIFDPFFTTKKIGTGLGLSVVKGIISNHFGEITVKSDPGKGTTFTILFPVEVSSLRVDIEETATVPVGEGHVLIVDDEVALAKYYGLAMEKLGYQVSIRNTGIEALELVRANPGKFDLIFTDQAMPRMGGIQLSENLKTILPDLPIIMATGFCTDGLIEKANEIGISEVLKKPIKFSKLAQSVSRVLSRSEQSAIQDN